MCEMDQTICLSIVKEELPESISGNFIDVEIENDNIVESGIGGSTEKQEVLHQNLPSFGNFYDTRLVVCKEELDKESMGIATLDKELKDNIKEETVGRSNTLSMGAKSKTSNELGQTRQSKKLQWSNQQIQEVDQKKLPSVIKDEPAVIMKETFVDIKIEYDESGVLHDKGKEELLSPKWPETCHNGHVSSLVACKEELWDNRLGMGHPKTDISSPADCKKTKRPHLPKKSMNQGKSSLEYGNNLHEKLMFNCANKADSVKMGTHIGKKTFTCIICDIECAQKKSLVTHMMSHTGEKPFSCNMCSYKSRYKAHLVIHKRTHTGERPFPCSYCIYAFSRKQNLVDHMRTHTGEKPFACSVCQYVCSQKYQLVSHMRTHTGEKPFSCHICNYRCRCETHLIDHVKTQTGEKTFSCSLCNFKCRLRQNLVQHERTHTGEKPFSCNLCDFKCGRKQNLITHLRTHTGERPFSCNLCDYKCARKQNLMHHMKTHTGEKPFICSLCDNKFGRKETLVKHMRTHTGEKSICMRSKRLQM